VEETDVEVVLMGVQQQLGMVILDKKAVRQEQHIILVQRKIPCHCGAPSMVELCDHESRRQHTGVCALHVRKPRMLLSNSAGQRRLSLKLLRNDKV
jgi:hypothetical protein